MLFQSLAVLTLLAFNAIHDTQLISLKAHQEELTAEEADKEIERILTDYSQGSELSTSLCFFVSEVMGINQNDLKIEGILSGGSGDSTYRVLDSKTSQALFIVKSYRENSQNYLPEIFSLEFLKQAQIDHFSTPNLLGVGKCSVGNICYFLLLESLAPGRCLGDLCHDVAKHPPYSRDRDQSFDILLKGVRACGKSLAELHSHLQGKESPLSDKVKKIIHRDLEATIEELGSHPEIGVDLEKLRKYIEFTIQNLDFEPHPPAFTYGDVKWMHAFFDPNSNSVTWIDPPTLSLSIGNKGEPVGMSTRDFYAFMSEMDHRRVQVYLNEAQEVDQREFLLKTEVETLKEAFQSEYQKGGGSLPTPRQIEFGSLLYELRFISWMSADITPAYPEPTKTALEQRREKIFAKLKSKANSMP